MTEEPTPSTPTIDLTQLKITPRETAQWEIALGMQLSQMPESYQGAIALWKIMRTKGAPLTIDEALDSDWQTIQSAMLEASAEFQSDPTQAANKPKSGKRSGSN